MRDAKHFVGNIGGLTEKLIRFIGKELTSPCKIDHCIDRYVGCMHTLGAGLASDALQQNTLRCLGGCEPSESRPAAIG